MSTCAAHHERPLDCNLCLLDRANAFSAAGSGVAMEKMASLDMPKGESLGTKYDMEDAQLLGRGKFSTVHRTQRRADGMTVAIKTIQVRSS